MVTVDNGSSMVFLRAYYVVSDSMHRKVFVSMVKIAKERTV